MKANVFTSIFVALFLFVTNNAIVKADSDAVLYHNVEKYDNVVSTTYFKGDGQNERMIPFKKKVNTMDDSGLCLSKITYIFDVDNKSWIPSDKMLYNYTDGKLVSMDRLSWNQRKGVWGEPQRTSYSYASDGSVIAN